MDKKIEKQEYEKTYLQIKKIMEEFGKSVARTVNLALLYGCHESQCLNVIWRKP